MPAVRRREALVAAAVRIVAREGVAAATTRAIAAEAGMPLGALHHAFGSRDELLVAVIAEVTAAERRAAVAVLDSADPGSGPEEVLLAALQAYLQLLAHDPARELALLEITVHALRHGMDDLAREQHRTYRRTVEHALQEAATSRGFRWTVPVPQAAAHLAFGLDGLTTAWLVDRDPEAAASGAAFLARSLAALTEPAPTPGEQGC